MTTDNDTCGNCEFFDEEEKECHRLPPSVVFDAEQGGAATEFPEVDPDDRCGEFRKAK